MSALHLVDSRYAWFMAAMCFWVQVWSTIVFRCSGMLLVGLVDNFGISREEAAWPFELYTSINSAQGFVAGVLVAYWDTRVLNMGATLLAATAVIGCFIWNAPTAYIMLIGFAFGISSGIMVPTNVVVLNRYFDKYRASASGLHFSGAALSSVLLPSLIGWLLEAYGLQGTMLIVGALVLNGVPAAIVLHSTPTHPREPLYPLSSSASGSSCSGGSANRGAGARTADSKTPVTGPYVSTGVLLWESGIFFSTTLHAGRKRRQRRLRPGPVGFLWEPMFAVLMLTGMAYGYVFSTYLMTIVDHAVDVAHASSEDGALLISAMAVGDFCSRLVAGYITDRRFITREQLLIVNFAVQGACYVLLTRLASLTHMLVLALVFGLNNGGTIAALPVLLADHLGDHHLPLTYGLHRLTMGVATLFRPMLIGYFKDKHGSYNGLFYLVAGFSAFTVVMWSFIIAADSVKGLLSGRPNDEDVIAAVPA